jgi:hypothetical protein
MKKVLHIIPGWEETCRRKPYKELTRLAEKKGYEVICHKVDWSSPLSPQVFPIGKDDVIFGFSLGAILAWLVAEEYNCKHLILASMTPHYNFTDKKIKKLLNDLTGTKFVNDIVRHLDKKHKAKKQTVIYGDKEEEKADILVLNTNHELNDRYIKTIIGLI